MDLSQNRISRQRHLNQDPTEEKDRPEALENHKNLEVPRVQSDLTHRKPNLRGEIKEIKVTLQKIDIHPKFIFLLKLLMYYEF